MDFEKKTDKELVNHPYVDANGSGPQLEMMRRLKDSIEKASEETNYWSKVMVVFSFILFIVGIIQLGISIFSAWQDWKGALIFLFAIGVIFYWARKGFNEFLRKK